MISPLFAHRFWNKVDLGPHPLGCWLWTGSLSSIGYGRVCLHHKLGLAQVHRVSWMMKNGPIPIAKMVLHRCDIRNCVNPDHLFLGTQFDNMRDMVSKGRRRSTIGSLNPKARFTEKEVLEIRRRRASGEQYMQIARDLGCAFSTIRNVCVNNWKHLNKENEHA